MITILAQQDAVDFGDNWLTRLAASFLSLLETNVFALILTIIIGVVALRLAFRFSGRFLSTVFFIPAAICLIFAVGALSNRF